MREHDVYRCFALSLAGVQLGATFLPAALIFAGLFGESRAAAYPTVLGS